MIKGTSFRNHRKIEYPFNALDVAYIIDHMRREELDKLSTMFRVVGIRRPTTQASVTALLVKFGIEYSPMADVGEAAE